MNSTPRLRIPVSDEDHSIGPKNAPLELVEYGDYECPFCRRARGVTQQLTEELGDDLLYVFRNFPLAEIHPHAMNAAKAAEAAGLQGQFWEMHDMLFENQENLDDESLLSYATAHGLDPRQFVRDMNNSKVEKRILSDFQGGARSGVNGTPAFFINGFRYDGDWSYDSLSSVLTRLLRKSA